MSTESKKKLHRLRGPDTDFKDAVRTVVSFGEKSRHHDLHHPRHHLRHCPSFLRWGFGTYSRQGVWFLDENLGAIARRHMAGMVTDHRQGYGLIEYCNHSYRINDMEVLNMAHDLGEQCGNCSLFFPDSDGPTEYGICINDPAFAPYEDDIFELRFDRCRELIKAKRFPLTREICEKFEPIEFVEITTGDGSTEPLELTTVLEATHGAEFHMAFDQNGDIWLNGLRTPLQSHIDQLHAPKTKESALNCLSLLASKGNEQATTALLDFFERLGPPRTLPQVHFKMNLLRKLLGCNTQRFLELLLTDLETTPSNNTTRQWITAIIKHLPRFAKEDVEIRLNGMIRRNVFSHRLRRRIEDLLDDAWE